MIDQTVRAGRAAGIGAAVCGEMASDIMAAPLLIGLGVEELSMSAPFIPGVKRALARCTLPEAQAIARQALDTDSSESVRRLLHGALAST